MGNMNKARLAEAGRGFIPNRMALYLRILSRVDLCVSAEHIRRYDIDPQTCQTRGKDRGINGRNKRVCIGEDVRK